MSEKDEHAADEVTIAADTANADTTEATLSSSDRDDDGGDDDRRSEAPLTFSVSGRAAHSRIAPLLPPDWVDVGPYASANASTSASTADQGASSSPPSPSPSYPPPRFLWENAPRYETRPYRDGASAYSHLPNGTAVLDDKWALARLLPGRSRRRGEEKEEDEDGNCDSDVEEEGEYDNGQEEEDEEEKDYEADALESRCFRGPEGFRDFCESVGMFDDGNVGGDGGRGGGGGSGKGDGEGGYRFPDLLSPPSPSPLKGQKVLHPPPSPQNLWVIKDANSNGAGGIWVVDPSNAASFLPPTPSESTPWSEGTAGAEATTANEAETSTATETETETETEATKTPNPPPPPIPSQPPLLIDGHRYVAQRYAWPPVLYGGRKCHVRVYALLTSSPSEDGGGLRAYVHRRCFLHVANEPFGYDDGGGTSMNAGVGGSGGGGNDDGGNSEGRGQGGGGDPFDPSVHITNCCANSHDPSKFAGEICADLSLMPAEAATNSSAALSEEEVPTVPLGEYFPAISASVAALARNASPFLGGGEANGGFEYLGLDFVLSVVRREERARTTRNRKCGRTMMTRGKTRLRPAAYLLEVNAPPSQDTATGLRHAEELHDDVLRDLLSLWVIPRATTTSPEAGSAVEPRPGGWRLVFDGNGGKSDDKVGRRNDNPIVPSKAAILNKVRWAMFERRTARTEEREREAEKRESDNGNESESKNDCGGEGSRPGAAPAENDEETNVGIDSGDDEKDSKDKEEERADRVCAFARSQFPYFSRDSDGGAATGATDALEANTASAACACASPPVFLESAGGSQVPSPVVRSVASALADRHRSVAGAAHVASARRTLLSLLGADDAPSSTSSSFSSSRYEAFLGYNATSLLDGLSRTMVERSFLRPGDEVVISTENHRANSDPWVRAAERVGATVRWWTGPYRLVDDDSGSGVGSDGNGSNDDESPSSSPVLARVLTPGLTRIVAVPHASNVLGIVRDVKSTARLVRRVCGNGRKGGIKRRSAHVVVDGVAAVPHVPACLSSPSSTSDVDGAEGGGGLALWYAASCHKAFGPHLGVLCGTAAAVEEVTRGGGGCDGDDDDGGSEEMGAPSSSSPSSSSPPCPPRSSLRESLERGTPNYESCAGVQGMATYFQSLSSFGSSSDSGDGGHLASSSASREEARQSRRTRSQSAGEEEATAKAALTTATVAPTAAPTASPSSSLEGTMRSSPIVLSPGQLARAYESIRLAESRLSDYVLEALKESSPRVRILGDDVKSEGDIVDAGAAPPPPTRPGGEEDGRRRLGHSRSRSRNVRIPIVSFVHETLDSRSVAEHCRDNGVVCRAGTFLATEKFLEERRVVNTNDGEAGGGVVRLSFAHYNTIEEARRVVRVLKAMEGW